MLSVDAPTIGAANKICARDYMNAFLAVNTKYFRTSKKCKPISHGNRHEWVCGPTTSERSDWRRLAYPEMAVFEGEFKDTHTTKQPRNRHEWVCGLTTSERSDWRRLAYPEMAVCEG
jgi:hypothetical protein